MPRGGYKSVVHEDGSLLTPSEFAGLLVRDANPEDVVTQMYGMIWYLAWVGSVNQLPGSMGTDAEVMPLAIEGVETAFQKFQEGLKYSPTPRFKES